MNFFTKIKSNWIPVIGSIVVVIIFIYAAINAYQNYSFEKTVETLQTGSRNDVTNAITSEKQAANFEVERRTEDGVREQVITPKLQTARAKSAGSAQSLKNAKQKLNEIKNDIHNVNANRAANCAELQSLFPDERFEYCLDR